MAYTEYLAVEQTLFSIYLFNSFDQVAKVPHVDGSSDKSNIPPSPTPAPDRDSGDNRPPEPVATAPIDQPKLPFTSVNKGVHPPSNANNKLNSDGESSNTSSKDKNGKIMAPQGSSGGNDPAAAPPSAKKPAAEASTVEAAVAAATAPATREDGRPAHVMPFWNRTNWIAGRKDGTGSHGAAADKRGGSSAAAAAAEGKSKIGGGGREGGLGNGVSKGTDSKRARDGAKGDEDSSRQDGRVLRYQFRAGYTNAVRRPVRMRDLM